MSIHSGNIKRYLSLLSLMLPLSLQPINALAQQEAQQINDTSYATAADDEELAIELNQAELDQLLAPIALYPDTLLSHILVAATYPLEVVQAARWRKANSELDEQEALDAVEVKNWDPSVKALVPFNDLLQKFSDDLDWLQSLGDAFLANEQQVLDSVQNLRQKAYAQGNLQNNEYIEVEQTDDEIIIQPVKRDVIYVPYYDTRVVYGNWWWDDYPPFFWYRPSYTVWHSGFYWSPSYYISPAFYFGGFRWHERYVYVNYGYRNYAHANNWHNDNRQVVKVKEYPRWHHDESHRRGVHYTVNGHTVSREYSALKTTNNRYVADSHSRDQAKAGQADKKRELQRTHATQQDKKLNHAEAQVSREKRQSAADKRESKKSEEFHNVQRSKQVEQQLKSGNSRKVSKEQHDTQVQTQYSDKKRSAEQDRQSSGQQQRAQMQPKSTNAPVSRTTTQRERRADSSSQTQSQRRASTQQRQASGQNHQQSSRSSEHKSSKAEQSSRH